MDTKVTKTIDLTGMTTVEAKWLMGVMQNALHRDESDQSIKMREKFFDALHKNLFVGPPKTK